MSAIIARIVLIILAALGIGTITSASGCVSTATWKIDADQHTTGEVEGSITPQPIPGITPGTPAASISPTNDDTPPTLTAHANLAAYARFNVEPGPAPHEAQIRERFADRPIRYDSP